MRRTAAGIVAGLIALVVVVSLAGYAYLRRSLPVLSGSVTVNGISAPIDISRDGSGIPHIEGATRRDVLFGLGYVHAQDRLWQMEFQRRIAHGRLSEVFGEATLAQDRFLRTLGTGRAARAAWDRLPPEAREDILAYAGGVNAFVDAHRGARLPPEFSVLRIAPEPWTGPDVVGWVKMMAWDLSANYALELLRYDLATRVGGARADRLMSAESPDSLSILSPGSSPAPPLSATPLPQPGTRASAWAATFAAGLSSGHAAVADALLGGARVEALGSNNWVVNGHRTASGYPLLANDPHLGTRIPSVWYLARLSAADGFEVAGATLPGGPGVAIGRNRDIAWGLTNVAADVQDFYLERLNPAGTHAEFAGAFEPLRTVVEAIEVRGGDPVRLEVRLSRHGPLVSDAVNANTAASGNSSRPPLPPLALRWTALDDEDTTVLAFLRVNQARNWREFTDALRAFVVPSQNFVYADREGHIGYYAPGRIPIRQAGDGRYPAEGWSGEMEWLGWVPFEELPHLFDPPGGVIVTANNRPGGGDYPYLIGRDFPEPYRARRILDRLEGKTGLTTDDFAAIQADTFSLHARDLLPRLLALVRPAPGAERQAAERLGVWTFDATAGSAEAALFQAWFLQLVPAIAGDELGPELLPSYRGRYSHVARFIAAVLDGDDEWCDDVRTAARESCEDAVTTAFRDGLADVTTRMGRDPDRWQRGPLIRAVFPHQGLDAVPLLRPLLSRSVPGHGDWSTVNVGPAAGDRPFEQRSVPSYRQIVDLSPADDSRFIDAVGQSGHFLSRHYDDFLPSWGAVTHRPMHTAGDARGAGGRLRLVPGG